MIHELRASMYGADPTNTHMPQKPDLTTQFMQFLAQIYMPGLIAPQANVPTAAQGSYADVPSHASGGSIGYHQPGSLEQNIMALGGDKAIPIIMALHKASGGLVESSVPKMALGGNIVSSLKNKVNLPIKANFTAASPTQNVKNSPSTTPAVTPSSSMMPPASSQPTYAPPSSMPSNPSPMPGSSSPMPTNSYIAPPTVNPNPFVLPDNYFAHIQGLAPAGLQNQSQNMTQFHPSNQPINNPQQNAFNFGGSTPAPYSMTSPAPSPMPSPSPFSLQSPTPYPMQSPSPFSMPSPSPHPMSSPLPYPMASSAPYQMQSPAPSPMPSSAASPIPGFQSNATQQITPPLQAIQNQMGMLGSRFQGNMPSSSPSFMPSQKIPNMPEVAIQGNNAPNMQNLPTQPTSSLGPNNFVSAPTFNPSNQMPPLPHISSGSGKYL
jgi:hypothetical protein